MSTIVCTRMLGPKCISSIGNNACRLLPNISLYSLPTSNLKLQLSEHSMIAQQSKNVRNISLSSIRLKEVFQRNKPHLNIGKFELLMILKIGKFSLLLFLGKLIRTHLFIYLRYNWTCRSRQNNSYSCNH